MKKALFGLFLLFSFGVKAQTVFKVDNTPTRFVNKFGVPVKTTVVPMGTDSALIWIDPTDSSFKWAYKSQAQKALRFADTIATVLTKTQGDASYVRIQTQNPTSTLSGGYSYERRASGTFTPTLSWSAGRLAAGTGVNATNPISTIVVGGVSQTFSQPSAGSSVSGTQVVTVTNNTNSTFTNTVTTTDSKTASVTTSFTVYDKRYIGWAVTSTPTSAEILAAVYQDNSGGNASINTTLSVIGTARYLFIVNTVNQSSITVNGFPSTAAFSLNNTVTFTNASGGTFTGKYTVSNAPIGNAGSTTLIIN